MDVLVDLLAEVDKLGSAEVAAVFAPVVEHRGRARWLTDELDRLRRAGESEYNRVVQAVFVGAMPVEDAPARLAAAQAFDHDSPTSRAVAAASSAAWRQGDAAAREVGEAAFRALQRLVAAIVKESVDLAAKLPRGVSTEALAVRSGDPEVVRVWTRLGVLVRMWDQAHGVAWHVVMRAKLTGEVAEHDWGVQNAALFVKYQEPERLPGDYFTAVAPELRISTASRCGAGPGLVPITRAAGRARKSAINTGKMHVIPGAELHQVVDADGNLVGEQRSPNQLVSPLAAAVAVSPNARPMLPVL